MAKQGFKILDSDMHIMEPWDLWQRYIEPEFRERAPVGMSEDYMDNRVIVEGKEIRNFRPRPMRAYASPARRELLKEAIERNFDAVSELHAMDTEGIDATVLFPTRGSIPIAMNYQDTRLVAAIARAYNNWLADFIAENPGRLMGAAMVPLHDVEEAIIEVRRARKDLGFLGVYLRPNPIGGHNWHDAMYDPFWAECQDLDMPVCFHEGRVTLLPQAVAERFNKEPVDNWMLGHVASHPMEMMYGVLCAISGGILERFPRLRMAFLEANCSWAPYWLWRIDEHYKTDKVNVPKLTMKPSEYYKRQCYTAIEPEEEIAKWHFERLGNDNIVFSTDYPHVTSEYPHAVDHFLGMPFSDETKRKILWDNCARLYNFK